MRLPLPPPTPLSLSRLNTFSFKATSCDSVQEYSYAVCAWIKFVKIFMHYDYALVTCAPCKAQQCASREQIWVKWYKK
jgi:hypothetical protein